MIRQFLKGAISFFMKKVVVRAIAIPIRRRIRAFEASTCQPQRLQEEILRKILAEQAETGFGRDHHFANIRQVADYRRNVPVAGYDAIEPYLARVRKGETRALLSDPHVYMFALTSGTTATRKFIPVTRRYLDDYKRSWNIWGLKAFEDHKESLLKPILQMAGDSDEMRTESNVPCGAVTGLTATMQKRIVRRMYCVPACVGRIKDPMAKYYVVLRQSIRHPKMGLMVAANPSTMLSLARAGDQFKEGLIRDIHDGTLNDDLPIPEELRALIVPHLKKEPQRARELEEIVRRTGTLYPKDYWKTPFLLGNWTGGSVGAYLRHYPRYFGDNPVRDVGLIASEGRMTIPVSDHTPAGILDITSHYFEFIPESEISSPNPTVLGAHELSEGKNYFILLTTGYGLYRYNIHDLVRVAGFYNQTPLIEFLGKGSLFSNLTGEKLSEYQVTRTMAKVLQQLDLGMGVWSLAPIMPDDDRDPPCYGLFLESADVPVDGRREELLRRLDEDLQQMNIEYEAKRASQRLGPIRLEVVPTGMWQEWDRRRLERSGGTLEQYKHPCLIGDLNFYQQVRPALAG